MRARLLPHRDFGGRRRSSEVPLDLIRLGQSVAARRIGDVGRQVMPLELSPSGVRTIFTLRGLVGGTVLARTETFFSSLLHARPQVIRNYTAVSTVSKRAALRYA